MQSTRGEGARGKIQETRSELPEWSSGDILSPPAEVYNNMHGMLSIRDACDRRGAQGFYWV